MFLTPKKLKYSLFLNDSIKPVLFELTLVIHKTRQVNRFILYTIIFGSLPNNLSEEVGKNETTRNMGNNKVCHDTGKANPNPPFFAQSP
jgi:hypothetical protein